MYQTILVTLDATAADRTILDHVRPLARAMNSRLVLLHVADGWTARTYGPNAVSAEVDDSQSQRIYLDFAVLHSIAKNVSQAGAPAFALQFRMICRICIDLEELNARGIRRLA